VRRVHEQLSEPLEDLLDLERVWLLEVGGCEGNANIANASCDFLVGL
jgi:hypothetical protein